MFAINRCATIYNTSLFYMLNHYMNPFRIFVGPLLFVLSVVLVLSACSDENSPVKRSQGRTVRLDSTKTVDIPKPAPDFHYHFISLRNKNKAVRDSAAAVLKALTPAERNIMLRLNRVDAASYKRLDTIVIPDKVDT